MIEVKAETQAEKRKAIREANSTDHLTSRSVSEMFRTLFQAKTVYVVLSGYQNLPACYHPQKPILIYAKSEDDFVRAAGLNRFDKCLYQLRTGDNSVVFPKFVVREHESNFLPTGMGSTILKQRIIYNETVCVPSPDMAFMARIYQMVYHEGYYRDNKEALVEAKLFLEQRCGTPQRCKYTDVSWFG